MGTAQNIQSARTLIMSFFALKAREEGRTFKEPILKLTNYYSHGEGWRIEFDQVGGPSCLIFSVNRDNPEKKMYLTVMQRFELYSSPSDDPSPDQIRLRWKRES